MSKLRLRSSRAKSRGAGTKSSRAPLDFARDERVLCVALASLLLIAAAPSTAIDAERAFSDRAQTEGLWTAFRATAAEEALMFVPRATRAHDFLKDREDPLLGYVWWPAEAFVSCDGQVTATTGPSVLGRTRGYFTTVWIRQLDGAWKWILDHGDALASPRLAGERPKVRRAACSGLEAKPGQWVVTSMDTGASEGIGPSHSGEGVSGDGSFKWSWRELPGGGRRIEVALWNGRHVEPVIVDEVAGSAP